MSHTDNAGLSAYLKQLQGIKRLTREEEVSLTAQLQQGSVKARNELVRHNLRFVVVMAKRYANPRLSLNDLIQVGNLGLLKATESFDPGLGNRFATYAAWWVRAYLARFCAHSRSAVRRDKKLPVEFQDLSLDAPSHSDDELAGPALMLPSREQPADERFDDMELATQTRDALLAVRKRIGDLGWDIMNRRLMSDDPTTLEAMGNDWGLSRETVRIAEHRTKVFLKSYLGELLSVPSSGLLAAHLNSLQR